MRSVAAHVRASWWLCGAVWGGGLIKWRRCMFIRGADVYVADVIQQNFVYIKCIGRLFCWCCCVSSFVSPQLTAINV